MAPLARASAELGIVMFAEWSPAPRNEKRRTLQLGVFFSVCVVGRGKGKGAEPGIRRSSMSRLVRLPSFSASIMNRRGRVKLAPGKALIQANSVQANRAGTAIPFLEVVAGEKRVG